jgi:UDP-glucuronate 4-epimerase
MENAYGRKAIIENYPMQDGDVKSTHADINDLVSTIGYKPQISIQAGIAHFAEWYTDFYNINKEKFK